MFGIGLPELILIMALALIVVGPEKLPDLAKTLARQLLELKKVAASLQDSLKVDSDEKPWEHRPPTESLPPRDHPGEEEGAAWDRPDLSQFSGQLPPEPEKKAGPEQGVEQGAPEAVGNAEKSGDTPGGDSQLP